ncbi:LytR/AlgR family response regulator transcription factor [Catenovulum sp. SX2]|uniref:LytR/AlgR family response regulator transcription factor n=1 Tax=Catenovulum sp. SX2 TaxID=3398614 RepID=UPI003F82E258
MKAIVIEDSRPAREGLIRMLAEYPNIEVIGEAANVATALTLIRQHQPQVLFLDIHLPQQNGFDLLEQLQYQPQIIFTTAYSEYAVKSFDYNTVDYLLKPIKQQRLTKAINKLSEPPRFELKDQILVTHQDEQVLVTLSAIELIESCKNYAMIFWRKTGSPTLNKSFIKSSLNQVEQKLPQQTFFRCNRQFIVNTRSIDSLDNHPQVGCSAQLKNGRVISISRRNIAQLKQLLRL